MNEVEIGFVAYKNKNGFYDKKIPICRKVENLESIYNDYLNKWNFVLKDWFAKIMEVEDAELISKTTNNVDLLRK